MPVSPSVANPDPPIKNTLESVFGLIIVIILKRVREYFLTKQQIYSMKDQRWKIGCKIFDLMVFNLRKITHHIQSKKYLRKLVKSCTFFLITVNGNLL